MHIPMTCDEIAGFLEVKKMKVELLWRSGLLQRSFQCAYRPAPEFGYSTVYDVLEYALAAGVLPVTLTKEIAALWVAQLAEADEWDVYSAEALEGRITLMMELSIVDGLSEMTDEPCKVAAVIVAAQTGLVMRCHDAQIAV